MVDRKHIAKSAFLAYANDDRDALEAIIADDFRFTSPLDNGINRKTYFERCWPNHKVQRSYTFSRLVEQGDEVIVTYEAETVDGRIFRNTEVLTIGEDSKIHSVEVYFGWSLPHKAPQGGFTGG